MMHKAGDGGGGLTSLGSSSIELLERIKHDPQHKKMIESNNCDAATIPMKICFSPWSSMSASQGRPEFAIVMIPKMLQAVCMQMRAMRVVKRDPSCFLSDMAVMDPGDGQGSAGHRAQGRGAWDPTLHGHENDQAITDNIRHKDNDRYQQIGLNEPSVGAI